VRKSARTPRSRTAGLIPAEPYHPSCNTAGLRIPPRKISGGALRLARGTAMGSATNWSSWGLARPAKPCCKTSESKPSSASKKLAGPGWLRNVTMVYTSDDRIHRPATAEMGCVGGGSALAIESLRWASLQPYNLRITSGRSTDAGAAGRMLGDGSNYSLMPANTAK